MALGQRLDNWKNAITGLGTALRDKTKHTHFGSSQIVPDETLEELYHSDDIAARVCDLVPDEMLRQGFSVEIDGAPDQDVHSALNNLEVREKFNEALVWSRVFGGAAIFMGVDDGQDQSLPLNLGTAKSINFLSVLDKRELYPNKFYDHAMSPKYGHPELYRLDNVDVHESRLLIFQGTRTSKARLKQNNGWAYSVLQRMYEVMQQFNLSWQSAAHLMSDAAQAVFKLKGLHAQIAANKTSDIMQRMEIVDMGRSVARAVLLDAEDEDFHRDTYSFGGVPELLQKFMLRLAAAAKMPVSLLMGQAPSGLNATGDADIRFFYDQIKAQQEHVLRPKLERLISVLLSCKQGSTRGLVPKKWQLTFPALWQQSEREKAEIAKINAEIDCRYIQEGVLLPEEVAFRRVGVNVYAKHLDML